MKVHVDLEIEGRRIDETIEAADADAILAAAKSRVAKELGFKGYFLRAMTPIAFAQEAVRRYNSAYGKSYALPATADDFLEFGRQTGHLTVIDQ